MPKIESISAVTLATRDMSESVKFYTLLGFSIRYGGAGANFTSFNVGRGYLNLVFRPDFSGTWWGRIIFYVADVDEVFETAKKGGLQPDTTPRDAEWGERYFHITDPDGHELSFAKLLA
jgi:catechol 2,3-dioxygenase-like lactoylglutathione lyase family enzyme